MTTLCKIPLVLVAACTIGWTDYAKAQSCDNSSQASHNRLLEDQAKKADWWNWGWGLGYGLSGSAQWLAAIAVDSPAERLDLIVGATTSTIGVAAIVFVPLRIEPAGGPCGARRALEQAARAEQDARSWPMHAGNFIVNLAGGLVIGFAGDRWADGASVAALGFLVGEVQILTVPSAAIGASAPNSFALLPSSKTETQQGWTLSVSGVF